MIRVWCVRQFPFLTQFDKACRCQKVIESTLYFEAFVCTGELLFIAIFHAPDVLKGVQRWKLWDFVNDGLFVNINLKLQIQFAMPKSELKIWNIKFFYPPISCQFFNISSVRGAEICRAP